MLLQELLGAGGPRHQFAIQSDPVGIEVLPKIGFGDRVSQTGETRGFETRIVEKRTPGSRVTRAQCRLGQAKARAGDLAIFAEDDYGAGSHVFFLADHLRETAFSVMCERFVRVFEEIGARTRF